ncbi:MAG: hypothetical protein DRI01_09550 [Chloroflexi bacterium]|nr:MAG: hypothetical protein DRI01_09550 [Chloroflexota bacterium]
MRKFNEAEIKEIIRTARVFAAQFTEEKYQKLVQMQQEIADSDFIEAAWGVRKLQQECGVSCAEAPGRYVQLVKEAAKEESKLSRLKEQRKTEEESLAHTVEAVRQVKEEHGREQKELERLRRQAAQEKKRLKEEVEHAMQEAEVNSDDIATATRLKAEAENHGLDLKLALRLFEEFANSDDAGKELAEAVAEYGSQLEAREALQSQNEMLRAEEEKRQQKLDELEAECQRSQQVLSQLRSDVKEQDTLRRFWWSYHKMAPILECLVKWGYFVPLRCKSFACGARFWVNQGLAPFRTKFVCPCCGLELVDYDDEAFTTLGLSDRAPIKIRPGE